ncbi:hypothetical protein AAGS61_18235 [Lysinibacillus sp. KU-BSD001]|uniref:hypothetical protein n=1 Tax=Lysinibacillus sp. KU-BSD001 TaxID=3141328 RepID=UPI0036EA6AC3
MGVYKELNEIEIDLGEFEEATFTKLEKKRVHKLVKKKLKLVKSNKGVGVAASALAIGLLVMNHQTIANTPFIAALLEDWGVTERVDWSSYKTVIGETRTTEMGDLTLNEVIVNYDKIMISATFEKNEATAFSYRHQLMPTVIINGEKVETEGTAAQSIAQNSSMYTIYSEITLAEPVTAANFDVQIAYDKMHTAETKTLEGETLEQPWVFDIKASQLTVQNETTVHDLHQTIQLQNDEKLVINRIVTTPISTTIFYSGFSSDRSPNILLYDPVGNRYHWNSASGNDDGTGEIHYTGASFVESALYIQVFSNSTEDDAISEKVKILN